MLKRYAALVGDVVGSKKIKDREKFQKRLQAACDQVNTTYTKDIYAPLKITKGTDEVSGVLTKVENLYKIVNTISEKICPYLIRFAIFYGFLDIALESKDAAKIDGDAFHKAAGLMSYLVKTEELAILQINDSLIDRLLTSQMNLIFFLKKRWTKRQFEVVTLYKELESQEKVANRLRITQPTTSDIIKSANYDEILKAEQTINDALREYQQRLDKEKS